MLLLFWNFPSKYLSGFDVCLCYVPCSGSGVCSCSRYCFVCVVIGVVLLFLLLLFLLLLLLLLLPCLPAVLMTQFAKKRVCACHGPMPPIHTCSIWDVHWTVTRRCLFRAATCSPSLTFHAVATREAAVRCETDRFFQATASDRCGRSTQCIELATPRCES